MGVFSFGGLPMSQVVIEFGRAMAPQPGRSADAPVYDPFPQAEEITSSGISQPTTMTSDAYNVATVINNGNEAIWVAFGAAPTAAVGMDAFVPANSIRDFGPLGLGMKAADINDT